MVGRARFGGIYSALNSREIDRVNLIFGRDDEIVYENLDVGDVYDMTLQDILDYASVYSSGFFFMDRFPKTPEEAELARRDREEHAYLGYITRKLVRYGKRFNVGLVYPPVEEAQEKGRSNLGEPIYGS